MDSERNPETSYRVERLSPRQDGLVYEVTTYAPVTEGQTFTKEEVLREDVLPDWVRVGMSMLDMASSPDGMGSIPFFGSRTYDTYWFQARQVYAA